MRERTASGPRALLHAARSALEEGAFALWRPLFGGQRLARPIFMIGCPRSGTSVSAVLFARHPDVAGFSEAGEVWDPRGYADPEADHHWPAKRVTAEEAARLHDRFEFARRLRSLPFHRGRRLLNKHPRNSVRIEYLRAVFPDAFFVHVIRDGRAVVHSMLEMVEREPARRLVPMGAFCKPPDWRALLREDAVEQAALQWREIVSYVLDQRPALGGQYHEYRYEDLCHDVRGVLGQAFAAAGLRADERVMARLPQRLEVQNFKWRGAFDEAQVETLLRVQGPLLERLGYGDRDGG
jgi:hypothetical protein